MLGRKSYTTEEIDAARTTVDRQLAAFRALPERTAYETEFGTALIVGLDRRFVHRVRPFSGKDTNPLTEVELIVDSVIGNAGVFTPGTVVKWQPEKSVTGLKPGDPVALTADTAAELATAFLSEVSRRSV